MRIQDFPKPSRFMFWCTAPFLVATLSLLPFLSNPVGLSGWIILGAFEALAIFTLFGLYDPGRFNWCLRIVGGIVFVGYSSYLISMVASGQWFGDGLRSSTTVLNALFGLILFGYPGFMYAVFGRLAWKAESVADDYSDKSFLGSSGSTESKVGDALFQQLDANGDGNVSRDEVKTK